MATTGSIRILLADDDPDDQFFVREALAEAKVETDLEVVNDGIELMERLARPPLPHLVLLDLNMPRMDGHEALIQIKHDPALRKIPVVILTTSRRGEDVERSYQLGGNTFISKPGTYPELVEVMKALDRFWFDVAEVPRPS